MSPRTTNHTPDIACIFARSFQWHRLLNFLFPYIQFLPGIRSAFNVFQCYRCAYNFIAIVIPRRRSKVRDPRYQKGDIRRRIDRLTVSRGSREDRENRLSKRKLSERTTCDASTTGEVRRDAPHLYSRRIANEKPRSIQG